jgi:hypothetical protein
MNINLMRLKGVITELRGLRVACERIADALEVELQQKYNYNLRPPRTDTTGPEPTVDYEDEEMSWARETVEHIKRREEALKEEDV